MLLFLEDVKKKSVDVWKRLMQYQDRSSIFLPSWSSEIAATMSHAKYYFWFTPDNWFYSFFLGEREGQYPGDSNRRIGRKNENDNPVRKWYICSSIITMFGFFMALGHSGFRHGPGETGKPCKQAVFMLLFPREIQRIKWKNGNFLIWSQIIVLNVVCSMFLVNQGTISWLYF